MQEFNASEAEPTPPTPTAIQPATSIQLSQQPFVNADYHTSSPSIYSSSPSNVFFRFYLYININQSPTEWGSKLVEGRFTQELRAEDDVLAVKLLTYTCSVAHRNGGLDDHDGVRVIFHDQFNYSLDRRCVKVLCLTVIVPALKFVRRSCSTVAYKAHLLPYVATYPLFRA